MPPSATTAEVKRLVDLALKYFAEKREPRVRLTSREIAEIVDGDEELKRVFNAVASFCREVMSEAWPLCTADILKEALKESFLKNLLS